MLSFLPAFREMCSSVVNREFGAQLDFGFTAYATTCYLKCSQLASSLLQGLLPWLGVLLVPTL